MTKSCCHDDDAHDAVQTAPPAVHLLIKKTDHKPFKLTEQFYFDHAMKNIEYSLVNTAL